MLNKAPPNLDHRLWFPDPRGAARVGAYDGLVAIGGDLSVPRLLLAYRQGIFPWTGDPITWWSPDPRAIFELDQFHVPRSLRRTLHRGEFTLTIDRAFRSVMEGCAEAGPRRRTTWVSPLFIDAYSRLHAEGHAHSVECWRGNHLVGGVYGVAIGGFFSGESMFHRATDASKMALYFLVHHLLFRGFTLFDIQMLTPVTQRLGAITLARDQYLDRLGRAVNLPRTFGGSGAAETTPGAL